MGNIENRLRETRVSKGLSQLELAKKSGVSRNTIIKIESGESIKVRLDTVVKLAESLDAPVTDIFLM